MISWSELDLRSMISLNSRSAVVWIGLPDDLDESLSITSSREGAQTVSQPQDLGLPEECQ